MEIFRKSFLFMVGVVVIAYDEAAKSIEEAAKTLEKRREQLSGHGKLTQPIVKQQA
ncbi:MAG TPA: hypothetical protein VF498_09275 [Anaerolineales bacterium]